MKSSIIRKAGKIELIIMDVDGVLTDGNIYLDDQGREFKAFNTQDGQGIKLAQSFGINFAIITGRNSGSVKYRAEELDIKEVYIGIKDKLKIYENLLEKYNIPSQRTAYIGDDISDLSVLKKVGLAVSVRNGIDIVKNKVDYVTERRGGKGAVRELIDLILKARGGFYRN
ncbi:MAG: KdsC family phosphatase [Bacillota bacterium]